jgi:hypothetical protein
MAFNDDWQDLRNLFRDYEPDPSEEMTDLYRGVRFEGMHQSSPQGEFWTTSSAYAQLHTDDPTTARGVYHMQVPSSFAASLQQDPNIAPQQAAELASRGAIQYQLSQWMTSAAVPLGQRPPEFMGAMDRQVEGAFGPSPTSAQDIAQRIAGQQGGSGAPVTPQPARMPEHIARAQAGLERAQQIAWGYTASESETAGIPHAMRPGDTQAFSGTQMQRESYELRYGQTGELSMSRNQVDLARTQTSNLFREAGQRGFASNDPNRFTANIQKVVQSGIREYTKGLEDRLVQEMGNSPEMVREAKDAAQKIRNMMFRATSAGVNAIAQATGGESYRDYLGAQPVSFQQLQQIAATDPNVAAQIEQAGGFGMVAAQGGGIFGGGGGGQAYNYTPGFGAGGGGGGGGGRGRGGMWGGGLGAAMYGMYIGQRIWGYTGGGVLEAGAQYGQFYGGMGGAANMLGPAGYAGREAYISNQMGASAYPYASSTQALRMMFADAGGGDAWAATAMGGGLLGLGAVGSNVVGQMGGRLGAFGSRMGGVLGPLGAGLTGANVGVAAANQFLDPQRYLGRNFNLMDVLRGPAALGAELNPEFQRDPAAWARANPGQAAFILSGSDLRSDYERSAGDAALYMGMMPGFGGAGAEDLLGGMEVLSRGGVIDRDGGFSTEEIERYFRPDQGFGLDYIQEAATTAGYYGALGSPGFNTALQRQMSYAGSDRFQYQEMERMQGMRYAGMLSTAQQGVNITSDRFRGMTAGRPIGVQQMMAQQMGQFGRMGFSTPVAIDFAEQAAGMGVAVGGAYGQAMGMLSPYIEGMTRSQQRDYGGLMGDMFGQMGPDQANLALGIMGGDIGAMSYAANTGQLGMGPESQFMNLAGQPIARHDFGAFLRMGQGQAGAGNPFAQQFFGAQATLGGAMGAGQPSAQYVQGFFGAQGVNVSGGLAGAFAGGGTFGAQMFQAQRMAGFSAASAGLQMQGVAAQQQHLWGGGPWTGTPAAGSMWAMQDTQRGMQWATQLANFSSQETRMDFMNQMGQQREAIGSQRMNVTNEFREWQTGFTRAGMDLTRAWAMEDRQYQDQMRTLQWGWNMEDMDENIRLSSGRQRRQLVTRRDRMVTQHGLQEDQIERQRERQEQLWAREDEQFDKRTQYQEDMASLDKESFDLNVEQRERLYEMDREDFERRVKDAHEMHELQEQIIKKQRDFQAEQLERQKQAAGISAAAAAASAEYAQAMMVVNEAQSTTVGFAQQMAQYAQAKVTAAAIAHLATTLDNVNPWKILSLVQAINNLDL